jgi:hypothetical protein
MLSYWFWPNPGSVSYGSPKILTLLLLSTLFLLGASLIVRWRMRQENPVTRKLAQSWPMLLRCFGFSGLLLTVARAEGIQFLSMRFLWILWTFALLGTLVFQALKLKRKHYTVIRGREPEDPRERYLPQQKKKRWGPGSATSY